MNEVNDYYSEFSFDDYQKQARRTETSQSRAKNRVEEFHPVSTRLMHGLVGLTGEVGELAAAIEGWVWYAKPIDLINLQEEIGDCLWYLDLMAAALNTDLPTIAAANIAKLRKRFPERFDYVRVQEENRDRVAEAEAIRRGIGTGEPATGKPAEPSQPTDYLNDKPLLDDQRLRLFNNMLERGRFTCEVCRTPIQDTQAKNCFLVRAPYHCPGCGNNSTGMTYTGEK